MNRRMEGRDLPSPLLAPVDSIIKRLLLLSCTGSCAPVAHLLAPGLKK